MRSPLFQSVKPGLRRGFTERQAAPQCTISRPRAFRSSARSDGDASDDDTRENDASDDDDARDNDASDDDASDASEARDDDARDGDASDASDASEARDDDASDDDARARRARAALNRSFVQLRRRTQTFPWA